MNGAVLESVARFASGTRNLIRVEARAVMSDTEAAQALDQARPIQDIEVYIEKYKQQGLIGDDLWNKLIEKAVTSDTEVDAEYLK